MLSVKNQVALKSEQKRKKRAKKYLKTKNLCVKNGLTCLNCGSTQLNFYLPKKKKKITIDTNIFPLNSGDFF